MDKQRKFSRKTVWLAMDSEYANRLLDIAIERIRLTRQISDLNREGKRANEDKLQKMIELDAERDSILTLFEVGECN